MTGQKSKRILEHILDRYHEKTTKSKALTLEAKKSLAGGDTRAATYFRPYPCYMVEGQGCFLTDCDGNRYVDFLNNYTSLIDGHAPAHVVEATHKQLAKGTVLGAPGECQHRHAEHLRTRMPAMKLIRYCNSGTEATMYAMRTARAYSDRNVIVKMDGGYHGSHDYAQVSVFKDAPRPALESHGIPKGVLNEIMVVPFNDLEAVESIIKEYKEQIAAIITEPMLGASGLILPQKGYLKGLRDLADRYKILLIFDEIFTFRLSVGGMQEMVGVTADITTVGKFIGGGFPIGAFGGRKEVMSPYNPDHPRYLVHSGTFFGSNITMVAGLAAMTAYDRNAIGSINRLGDRLRDGFERAFDKAGIMGRVTGLGSLIHVHWGGGEINNALDARRCLKLAGELPRFVHIEMMNRGIYAASRGLYCISTPMSEVEIDLAIEAFKGTLDLLKPCITETYPYLLAG
jgi:glutamate-1-semialdehyde 2,1-aminomutase